jgi:hypothetical protein
MAIWTRADFQHHSTEKTTTGKKRRRRKKKRSLVFIVLQDNSWKSPLQWTAADKDI